MARNKFKTTDKCTKVSSQVRTVQPPALVSKKPSKKNTSVDQPKVSEFMLSSQLTWPHSKLLSLALQPVPLVRRTWASEWAPMLLVFVFALMIYGITAPRNVTLEDDGLFLMNLHHFGVGHPPGYPLYTMLGGPIYHLLPDLMSPALRGHMVSALAAAIACVALYSIVAMLVRSRLCALAAAMAYVVSEAFWSQAIIAEVYALNAAMYFIVLALCLKYASHTGPPNVRHRALYVMIAFVYGLSLSNHWPLIGLGSVGLLLLVSSQWRTLVTRSPLGIICLVVGLLPYGWLVARSWMDTPINFYGPITNLTELWFYVTRSGYAGVDSQTGVGWQEKIVFTKYFFAQLVRQYTWAGLLLAVLGFVAMLRTRMHTWLALCLLLAWFMTGPILIFMLDFQTEFIWFSAFRVYHLLCYGITAIYLGVGLAWLGELLLARGRNITAVTATVGVAGALLVVTNMALEWRQNDRSDYIWARDFAMFRLLSVEYNSRLFTFDDLDLPLAYINYVEHMRPDVTVYNDQGLVFGNRVYTPFTTDQQRNRVLQRYIEQTYPLPVYYHPHRKDLFQSNNNGSDFLGFWRRVNRENTSERVILSEGLRLWLEDNLFVDELIGDRWTKQQAAGSVATLISAVHLAERNGFKLTPEWEEAIKKARRHNDLVHLLLLWNEVTTSKITLEKAREEIAWIDGLFITERDKIFDNTNWTDVLILKAQLIHLHPQLAKGDLATVMEEIILLALDYDFKYQAFLYYANLLRGQNRHDELIAMLTRQFPVVSNAPNVFREMHSLLIKELSTAERSRPIGTNWH